MSHLGFSHHVPFCTSRRFLSSGPAHHRTPSEETVPTKPLESRMTVDLPPEIEELVADHLCDDKATLGSYGLVCKSWLGSSRYHLFGDVLLHSGNSASGKPEVTIKTPKDPERHHRPESKRCL
ncbi:hypothetical protein DFH06DRAFT_1210502 [Mycena polygramma]|nr:hypothetical protein DFH06DRAFT_1210502 [Mycena polygramma]